jgi:protoporphyrinogen oxidase
VEDSVAQFVLRRLNEEFLERSLDPLIAGIFADDPQKFSVQHAFPKLLEAEQKYGSLLKGQFFGAERARRTRFAHKLNLLGEIEAQARGVFFAGSFRDGISLDDSIVSGANMAERTAEFLIPSSSKLD